MTKASDPETKRIVVVGSINLDLVASAPRIPLRGETVAGWKFATFPGGKGANQAVAAARLGASVSMIGRVGSDAFAVQLRESLAGAGVNTTAVKEVPGSSGVALIVTDESGENSITIVAGANGELSPQELDSHLDLIRHADIVLTQLEIPLPTIERLAAITQQEGIPLMLDPAPARELPASLLRQVTWLTPNESETAVLLKRSLEVAVEENPEMLADELLGLGCRNVVLKLGSRGCYLALEDGTRKAIPAYQVRAVDTTAAGDAFSGALAVALLRGKDPVESAAWASAVAAISVTRAGAQPSMPDSSEVDSFLAEQQPVTSDRAEYD